MTPVNKVTELKARKTKLSTIVTAISGDMGILVEDQMLTVNEWDASSARVIVHSAYKWPITPANGVRIAPTKHNNPLVADVLRAYIVQIPGNEIFAIAAPNVKFNGPQTDLFYHVEKEKMERAWACYCDNGESKVPVAFVLSAPVLPHILRDIPNTITFANPSWATWMDGWLSKFMLKHRYFNGNQFNVVGDVSDGTKKPSIFSIAGIKESFNSDKPDKDSPKTNDLTSGQTKPKKSIKFW